jgi:hypothetical protein
MLLFATIIITTVFAFADPLELTIYADVTVADDPPSQLHLDWIAYAGVVSYDIYYSANFGDGGSVLNSTSSTEFDDTDLQAARFYWIKGKNSGGFVIASSDTVGYFKIAIGGGVDATYTHFGWPGFKYFDVDASNVASGTTFLDSLDSDILDEQLTCGTVATADHLFMTFTLAQYNYRRTSIGCSWYQNRWFTKWDLDHGAKFRRPPGGSARHIILAGLAKAAGSGFVDSVSVLANAGSVEMCFPILKCRDVSTVGLLADGFTGGSTENDSDHLLKDGTTDYAWYDTDESKWKGALTSVCPGFSYTIISNNDNSWTYIWP